jgi:hypothetical protein
MRHSAVFSIVIMVVALVALAPPVQAQALFKVPFKFESGTKKFPAGDYLVTRTGDGQLTVQQVSTGKESVLPFSQKLTPTEPPAAEPRLVFDEVGNFEPSYTEYFTIYRTGRGLAVRRGGISHPHHEGRAQEPGRQRGGEEEVAPVGI